jgi:hypothetical protein
MRQRREELGGRAIGSHIRGRGAGFKGNKVDVIKEDEEQDILIAKMGWDGKPSGEVGSRPFTAMDGAGTGGEGGKGRLKVRKTSADARENSQRSDRAKTRRRDGLSGRGNSLSQGVQVPKGSRERQWGVLGDKFGSKEGNAVDKAFRQGFDEGRERGRAEGTMPVGHKESCRQRLKREEGRRTRQGSGNNQRRGDGRERDRQMPKVGLCRLNTTEEGG